MNWWALWGGYIAGNILLMVGEFIYHVGWMRGFKAGDKD